MRPKASRVGVSSSAKGASPLRRTSLDEVLVLAMMRLPQACATGTHRIPWAATPGNRPESGALAVLGF